MCIHLEFASLETLKTVTLTVRLFSCGLHPMQKINPLNWIQGTRKDNKWVSAIQYTDDFALKIVNDEKVDELDIYSEDSAYLRLK